MKPIAGLIRSTLGALGLVTLLVAPLGCAGVDEEGELVGEAAQALEEPLLVASSSTLDFGTIVQGADVTLGVTLTNTGAGDASFVTLAVPPDPYRTAHNPPTYLGPGEASSVTEITFAPTTIGTFARDIDVTYRGPSGLTPGVLHTLTIHVTGTAN
jgi:hypothetical protein